MSNTTYTFWQLIQDYAIEIPIIQRDYAQGRPSETEIRSEFLEAIHTHIEQNKPLDIDFVYGNITGNKFIPLDGQQRLTTLFLLHWYLANKEGTQTAFGAALTDRFSYETRISSRMFCSALIREAVAIENIQGSLSEYLKDQAWFFSSWEKDPTVLAMLVMLDAIHVRFMTAGAAFEKLTGDEHALITFQFIELKEYGLTDRLYIKMNARGKPLTRFENFKAQLEQALTLLEKQGAYLQQKEFADKLDGAWTDLFWNYRDKTTQTFDDALLNFFRVAAIYGLAIDPANQNADHYIDLLRDKAEPISFNKIAEMGAITPQYLNLVRQTLDSLSNGSDTIRRYLSDEVLINEQALFQNVINNNLDYAGLVTYYAFTRYLNLYQPQGMDDPQLRSWMRVARNLVEGSRLTYFNNTREFGNSLLSIEALLPHAQDILQHLTNPSTKITGFIGIQIDEEIVKAHLLLRGAQWPETLLPMENHGYFNGQISFLLKFAGISPASINEILTTDLTADSIYLEKLGNYFRRACLVFDDNGLRTIQNFRWERALLATGDYLLSKGQNYSFLINSDRDISWKRLLRDDHEHRGYVQQLLDQIDPERLEDSLKVIIDQFADKNDWRYHFIKYPKTISACGYNKYIRYNYDGYEILLLESSKTSAYHSELYSYALKLRLEKAGNTCEYAAQKSYWEKKFIYKLNNRGVKIFFGHIESLNEWRYGVRVSNKSTVYLETEDEVVDYLAAENAINPVNEVHV